LLNSRSDSNPRNKQVGFDSRSAAQGARWRRAPTTIPPLQFDRVGDRSHHETTKSGSTPGAKRRQPVGAERQRQSHPGQTDVAPDRSRNRITRSGSTPGAQRREPVGAERQRQSHPLSLTESAIGATPVQQVGFDPQPNRPPKPP